MRAWESLDEHIRRKWQAAYDAGEIPRAGKYCEVSAKAFDTPSGPFLIDPTPLVALALKLYTDEAAVDFSGNSFSVPGGFNDWDIDLGTRETVKSLLIVARRIVQERTEELREQRRANS